MSTELALYRLVRRSEAEGPGARAVVWVHGCSIRCPGCFNAHLWPERPAGHSTARLADEILSVPGIEGVTFLGGEPFEQAAGLADLADRVRPHGLSVMTFTGHRLEELRARGDAAVDALLDGTDLLVDGPYDRDRPDLVRPWVGSTNQRFHFLTERYRHLDAWISGGANGDKLEVRIGVDGRVFVNGMASPRQLRAVRQAVRGMHRIGAER